MTKHEILNNSDHRDLRVRTDVGATYGDNVMACLTVPPEFLQVQGHFPIVFRRDFESDKLSALALFGFENGENLFLEGDRWDARYRPLALAIQPFLVGRSATVGGESQVHVDLGHPRISESGEGTRVFDENGMPTPYLEAIAEKLGDLDQGYLESAGFFGALERYELLEPFTLEVPLNDGSKHSLVGFQTIDERRLATLEGEALGALHAQGYLLPIFMALASVAQFSELVARKNARVASG